MVDPMDNPNEGDELELPEEMKAQLRSRYGPLQGRPGAAEWSRMDAALAPHLQSHFDGSTADTSSPTARQTSPSGLGRWMTWRIGRVAAALATAAAIGVVVWINTTGNVHHDESPNMANLDSPSIPRQPGDINRDGRVDILDAYLLQRRIETAAKIEAQWDLTRDGQVDRHDVEAIAAESVRLNGGPRL